MARRKVSVLIPLEEAQKRLLDMAAPLGEERIAVDAAAGRYLAAPLTASRTQPPHDLSAMDGYALNGQGPWKLVGESKGGAPFSAKLTEGQAVRISTGAFMPDGSDRMLIQENARIEGETLNLTSALPKAGQHIRRKGFDFCAGDTLLEAGTPISAPQIALALSAGRSEILVGRRPSIALIEGGDELAASPENCGPHQIPASNNAMIAALAAPLASNIQRIGPVPDTMDAMITAFEGAESADIIVTSGGASVGDHDLVRPALKAWGASLDFWKVAIKPGKPILVARRGAKIIIGLPGNPVSSYATAFLFLLPLLRHLSGARACLPRRLHAPAGTTIRAGGPRREFLRAIWNGETVTPIQEQDSSALRALASTNAFIIVPEHAPETKAGTNVLFYLLQNGGVA